ncbi:hypothetical protein ACU7M1_33055, partial [Burkholderia pseudomallei]|uniref:hypothetical protein n=1 Tax=Burkholderia pseudomallei TaxID=28450 RepID=UPI00406BF463
HAQGAGTNGNACDSAPPRLTQVTAFAYALFPFPPTIASLSLFPSTHPRLNAIPLYLRKRLPH